ncbi:MAG: GAF domain-containing protein [Chloroflexi bacterium]|nr:GAF domain-containing protein [Chloroflexota bacterium]
MLKTQQYRQRLEALFAAIERLSADPAWDVQAVQQEIDEIRSRLLLLEADVRELEKCLAEQDAPPVLSPNPKSVQEEALPRPLPILYEKEWMGYAFSGDGVQPLRDPSEASPEIAVPLLAGGQPIGNVQIQPPSGREWTEEEISLLNLVAQQASTHIQNLRLLDATERARAEAENATRRFIHESWDSFLDAIHQSERVGFAYNQSAVEPFLVPPQADGGVHEALTVMDEHVGLLYLQPDPSRPITEEDWALVASIANQAAQQLENIRLLADASRARAESEEATRRLTRENWQSYLDQKDETGMGFVYDSNRVIPVTEAPPTQDLCFVHPLTVRGEAIGQLGVAGPRKTRAGGCGTRLRHRRAGQHPPRSHAVDGGTPQTRG